METRKLQFGKVMCTALLMLLMTIAGMKNAFAQKQVAVLQHNGEISAFYGIDAFVQAHNAATEGDTITLSSGTFNGCSISKAITLHGAGMMSDSLRVGRTEIHSDWTHYFDIHDNVQFLTVEGIFFNVFFEFHWALHHAIFTKCYFRSVACGGYVLYDVTFNNCIMANCRVNSASDNLVFNNCVLNSFHNGITSSPAISIYNSIIIPTEVDKTNLYLYNCIICGNASHMQNQYASKCIAIGETFPDSMTALDCMTASSFDDVFETWDGTFAIDADYSLKEDIATSFLGSDGKQVGIYGGLMPYNPRPTYMRPYRCNVAGFTTTDGHLNVGVEVAPEE
ncbi:hypothetical protein [uncultured Methanobrevibacter sp.]|uniref:hypothetical protein n=1 Tax=uncultured Methanobrevibacter sp. TaxID=253161 RepID=UPI00260D5AC6|nr:hypothetical protein [uncultured Methanobrevibacter sp.]